MDRTRSSLLENLRIKPAEAEFLLDGQTVRLSGDARSPALSAFRELHQLALADYENHQILAAQRSGIFSRLGGWLNRILGRDREPSAFSGSTLPAPAYSRFSEPRPLTATPIAYSGAAVTPTPGSTAHLQAVFADDTGIHVTWHAPDSVAPDAHKRDSARPIHINYSLDSEFARRLQRCYRELTVLGYKVKDLDALASKPEITPGALARRAPVDEPKNTTTAGRANPAATPQPTDAAANPEHKSTTATRSEPALAAASPPASTASQPSQNPPASIEVVMRLHPPSADHPARALVSAIDGGVGSPEVLLAPEKVLRALRATADESRPVAERLNYLRCIRGEKGLQITAVGFGETTERKPMRWEDAKTWWMEKGRTFGTEAGLDRTSHEAASTVPSPNFSAGTTPLRPHVEQGAPKRATSADGVVAEPEPG